MLIFSDPVNKYINHYISKKIPVIFIVGLVRGAMELSSLVIVLLYLNMFMDIEFDIPIDINLENQYVVIACILILFLSFFISYLSNVFMYREGTKISEKHALDISKSFVSQTVLQSREYEGDSSLYSKAKVVSMACQETHRLNLNINLPFIQGIFAILSILIIFLGLTLQFGYYIAAVLLFFSVMGLLIRLLIIPLMKKGAMLQKEGYRKFLEKYTYFSKSAFSQAISGQIILFIEKVMAHFAEHNKGYNTNAINGLNIKIGFETCIFLIVVIFVYLDLSYGFSDQVKIFLVANALASLRILPSAVNLARNLSIINSDTLLVKEHNVFIDKYLDNFQKNADISSLASQELVKRILKTQESVLLFGPSGGGKTTLAKLIAFDLYQSKKSVAFLDSDPIFDPEIKVKKVCENLNDNHIDMLKLNDQSKRLFDPSEIDFSRGQLQRIRLGIALKKGFDVLIMDEALNGVENNLELDIIIKLGNFAAENGLKFIVISHSKRVLDSELLNFVKEEIGA